MHNSTKWSIGILILMSAAIGLSAAFQFPMVLSYEWHKALHILGSVILLGNIIVTGVWMVFAVNTGDIRIIRFSAVTVNWADAIFTAPGTALLLINGLPLAISLGGIFTSAWISVSLILFSLSGIIWMAFLIPIQEKIIKLSHNQDTVSRDLAKKIKGWYFGGIIATILPIISLFLMILKPGLNGIN